MAITINEIFHSIQGEGLFSGIPTIFIRTTGCNLRCNWCDTRHAYEEGDEMALDLIVDTINILSLEHGHRNICITGGEPLIQEEVPELVFQLLSAGYRITLETNGTRSLASLLQFIHHRSTSSGDSRDNDTFLELRKDLHISFDIKCPSSGEAEKMDMRSLNILTDADQLKFVVKNEKDLEYAFDLIRQNPVFCPTIIQPVIDDEIDRTNLQELAKAFLASLPGAHDVRFMIQSHKVIWGNRKGV